MGVMIFCCTILDFWLLHHLPENKTQPYDLWPCCQCHYLTKRANHLSVITVVKACFLVKLINLFLSTHTRFDLHVLYLQLSASLPSSNKVQNGDILLLAYQGCSGKWPLNVATVVSVVAVRMWFVIVILNQFYVMFMVMWCVTCILYLLRNHKLYCSVEICCNVSCIVSWQYSYKQPQSDGKDHTVVKWENYHWQW